MYPKGEGPLHHVQQGGWVLLHIGGDGEDVPHPRGEIGVEPGAVAQVVGKGLRLTPHGDTHAGGDAHVGVQAHLGVEQEVVPGQGGVGGGEGLHHGVDLLHDAHAQRVGLPVAAVHQPPVPEQVVDRLGQTGDAEHGQKAVGGDKALLDQEAGGEEAGLLHQEADALVHVVGRQA